MTEPPGPPAEEPPGWVAPTGPGPTPPPADGPYPGSQPRPPYAGPPPGAPTPGAPTPGAPTPGAPGHQPPPYGYRPAPPRPGIIALRPLGLGDILDGTFKLIRHNPKATLGLSAVVAAITTLPLAIGQTFYYSSLGDLLANPQAAAGGEFPVGGFLAQMGGTLGYAALAFVGATILTGILTRVLGRAVFGGRITAGEAWRLTKPRILALFGLVLLTGLILLAPTPVLIGLIGLLVGLDAAPALTATVAVVAVLGYLVYLAFLYTRLALAAPTLVLEGRGVADSLRRSWSLVRGSSWRVLGILVLTQILVAVVGSVIAVPFSIASMVLAFVGGGSVPLAVVSGLLGAVGSTLSATVSYPVTAGVAGLLYADRRMRTEAFDLVLQTAATRIEGPVDTTVDDLWHHSHAAGGRG